MFPEKSEWQGKSTFGPDCSDKSEAPWGFATFAKGTVGNAILDWIINTWEEINDCFGLTLEEVVIEEFDFFINDPQISQVLAMAWIRDHAALLTNYKDGLKSYENSIKKWLIGQIAPFALDNFDEK